MERRTLGKSNQHFATAWAHPPYFFSLDGLSCNDASINPIKSLVNEMVGMEKGHFSWQRGAILTDLSSPSIR